jgi:hypothetical protein
MWLPPNRKQVGQVAQAPRPRRPKEPTSDVTAIDLRGVVGAGIPSQVAAGTPATRGRLKAV